MNKYISFIKKQILPGILLSVLFFTSTNIIHAKTVQGVAPSVETGPSHFKKDSADDTAIWINPDDPSHSVVIGDDKEGGLMVWDLSGKEIQYFEQSKLMNNLDIRYNFPLSGSYSTGQSHTRVDLVGVVNENEASLSFYKVNPYIAKNVDPQDVDAVNLNILESAGEIKLGKSNPYGGCMYLSPVSKKYYFFVNWQDGIWQQWELTTKWIQKPNSSEMLKVVDGIKKYRTLDNKDIDAGGQTEGCVADDVHGLYYIGEEAKGIWRYGAEPGDGTTRVLVDDMSSGRLKADVEGMSIYYKSNGQGYLIVSSQGDNTFAVYERVPQGNNPNAYIGSFRVANLEEITIDPITGKKTTKIVIDGADDTDGLDVVNFPLGPNFSKGMLVVHDASPVPSVNKYVPFENVATALGLTIDTTWNPRAVGSGGPLPTTPPGQPTTTKAPTAFPTNTRTPTKPAPCPQINTTLGKVDYTFNVKEAGEYVVWSRIKSSSSSNNSFWIRVDTTCAVVAGDSSNISSSNWTWINYTNGSTGNILKYNLTTGTHSFTIMGRENGVSVDKFIFTLKKDCIPIGFGDNCSGSGSVSPVPSLTVKAPKCPARPEGDGNCDSKIDLIDFVCWRNELAGKKPLNCSSADFNNDGTVNSLDYTRWFNSFIKKQI